MAKSSIKDFEILTRLGKGGFGTVYKVRRKADNNTYVLKLVPLADLDTRGQQAAVNEVHLLASLDHPYVVKYYDSFLDKKTLHIVMEYCDKGDLSSLIRTQMGRPLPEQKVWKLFLQVCLALEYLHSRRVLHRDIKPMNVFLARNDSIRVGDLGVAKRMVNSSSFAHTAVGTPYYLSPELCEDKPYNVKSDIWALGCVLYEMCMLKHPFDASNQGALYMKIIRASYPPVSSQYSPELREIVDLCLEKDYKKRPSAAAILSRPGMRERALGLSLRVPEDSALVMTVEEVPPPLDDVQPKYEKRSLVKALSPESPQEATRPKSRQALQPLRGAKPRIPRRPSSVYQPRESREHMEDVQEVLNLPDFKEPPIDIKAEPWKPRTRTLLPALMRPDLPYDSAPANSDDAKEVRVIQLGFRAKGNYCHRYNLSM